MLLSGPDLHCAGPLARWRFSQNKCRPKIKSYHLSAMPLALRHMVNHALVIALLFKKVRWEPRGSNFKIKTLNFSEVFHFNWLAKIKLRGPGLLVVNIIVNYRCTRVLLYAKNAEKYWNWRNNRLFCHIFIIGRISIGGGPGSLPPPSGWPLSRGAGPE